MVPVFNRVSDFKVSSPYFKSSVTSKRVLLATILFIALALVVGIFLKVKGDSSKNKIIQSSTGQRIQIKDAKVTKKINREFPFPLKDEKGQEVTKYKYYLDSAELRDQIIVKGQEASAVAGRTFLVINLKITNDYNKSITINSRDYLRFTINNNDKELLAADIHNDPVEVQAISTKYTRLGIPIDDKDKHIKLHVGEINGDKTTIDLNF